MNLDPEIVEKIRSWPSFMMNEMQNTTDPDTDPTDLQVLVHADLWINNQLYKLDDNGKPEDVVFVRNNSKHFGNPSLTLFFFV